MSVQAINLARSAGTYVIAAIVTVKNAVVSVVSVALRSLEFLRACYIRYRLRRACRPSSNPRVFRHLHKLPEPSELIRSSDGQIRVVFLCHPSFTIYNHYPPLAATMEQKYGNDIYRAFIDRDNELIQEEEEAFLADTPNVFILCDSLNNLIQDNDGQYSKSVFLNYWKTQYHTADRKQARVFIIDPVNSFDLPPAPRNVYDAKSDNPDSVYRDRDDIVVRRVAYWRGVTT